MIIDTSALFAIVNEEPDASLYERAIRDASHPRMSLATYLEATIVVEGRLDEDKGRELEDLVKGEDIELVPVTLNQVEVAQKAWRDFGKGNATIAPPSTTAAYALARTSNQPLLFKGNDFAQTDIPPAQTAP